MTSLTKEEKANQSKTTTWRWGIMGTGRIANDFALAMQGVSNVLISAVGSRDLDLAQKFANKFKIANAHGSYEDVAKDASVDIVYVSTLHNQHKENMVSCLQHGKHVLCEKPFTLNAEEAAEVLELAKEKKLFVMEAMWTRCFPLMTKLKELLQKGQIGELKTLYADYGYNASKQNDAPRLWEPEMAGGALLDIGIYPISLASFVFGPNAPSKVNAISEMTDKGIDAQTIMNIQYKNGELCSMECSIVTKPPTAVHIIGKEGRIYIHGSHWNAPTHMTLIKDGKPDEEFDYPLPNIPGEYYFSRSSGLSYEIDEVIRCLNKKLLESPKMPLQESLTIMQTVDKIRAQVGLKYPQE